MRRALRLAGRGVLFFGPGFFRYRITTGTFITVEENDPCLRILGDGIFRTGLGTGWIITVVTKHRLKIWGLLNNFNHSWAHTKPMFLFAGHLTGMAPIAIFLKKM